jgi:molecular chaperone GrpE
MTNELHDKEDQNNNEQKITKEDNEIIEDLSRENDRLLDILKRSQADLINYRKRMANEIEEVKKKSNSQLLLKLLSLVDDIERVMEHAPENQKTESWFEGFNLVSRNLDNILKLEGIKKIDANGKAFQPIEFDAVSYLETSEISDGHVVKVVNEGYLLRDKVLRPAQVVVSKLPVGNQDEIDVEGIDVEGVEKDG